MKLNIERLDYKNPTDISSLHILSSLNSPFDIKDINEVRRIGIEFESDQEAKIFYNKFPKYLGLRIGRLGGIREGKSIDVPYVSVAFNTFWMNKSTGDKNETAIKKRKRIIEILKQQYSRN